MTYPWSSLFLIIVEISDSTALTSLESDEIPFFKVSCLILNADMLLTILLIVDELDDLLSFSCLITSEFFCNFPNC